MEAIEIFKKWLAYTEYNPERNTIMLGSLTGDYHFCNQTISKFMPYNPSGEIGVLYAKHQFRKIMAEKRLNAFSVIDSPVQLRPHIDMWRLFCSDEVQSIERRVLDDLNELLSKVIPTKMLGQRDMEAERSALLGAVEAVVEALDKCNVDLFLKGGPIQRVSNFSTHIHVFNQLAECLLTLEDSQDGLYLCYIKAFGSVDGYFGFYLKSNGTILSVNERLNEAYPGEHKLRRNNRYAEAKQYALFPYSYIFSFDETGYDYKGYATSHVIDEDRLAFFNLKPEAYLPLVIAMALLRNRYENFDVADLPVQFVDSLLPVNLALPLPGTEALAVRDTSMIAQVNRELRLDFTTEDIMNGSFNDLIDRPRTIYDPVYEPHLTYKPGAENIFIRTYGAGFELDPSKLMESNSHLKALTPAELATTKLTPNAEFVGSAERMTQIAYMNGRCQLAEYIRDKMFKEYMAIGGSPAIQAWWEKVLPSARDKVISMCIERYRNGKDNPVPVGPGKFTVQMDLDMEECPRSHDISAKGYPFNDWPMRKSGYPDYNRPLCCITGQKASHFFTFTVDTDKQMRELVGAENVPAILTGYLRKGYHVSGNSSLQVTDPITGVGTPFEKEEYRVNRRLWSRDTWDSYYFHNPGARPNSKDPWWTFVPESALPYSSVVDFNFVIAFSKRGLAKLLKGDPDL